VSSSTTDRAGYVQDVFTRIAPRYDLMNRLMTAGQDIRWRKEVIRRARLQAGDLLLDLGAGTGDLAHEALRQQPGCRVVAADFTLGMMLAGKRESGRITWAAADALHLPFADSSFDAVVSGYLLRNVADLPQALVEMRRVLKPGGRWVALDTTRPQPGVLAPFIRFYLRHIIPALGALITGQRDAYTYLPESTQAFLTAEDLADKLGLAGFTNIGFVRRMAGTMAIHWAERGDHES